MAVSQREHQILNQYFVTVNDILKVFDECSLAELDVIDQEVVLAKHEPIY